MTLHVPVVLASILIVGGLWLYVDAGQVRWNTMCRRGPFDEDWALLELELSMTHIAWWRRWQGLSIYGGFIALWPAWLLLGFLLSRLDVRL